jgi:hypothetical protein
MFVGTPKALRLGRDGLAAIGDSVWGSQAGSDLTVVTTGPSSTVSDGSKISLSRVDGSDMPITSFLMVENCHCIVEELHKHLDNANVVTQGCVTDCVENTNASEQTTLVLRSCQI